MKLLQYIIPVMLLIPVTSDAQCRPFTKNKVLPLLSGYVQNDNFNSAVLVPGDEAELLLTFYSGKEYRLAVVAHPILGDVDFEVRDTNDQLVYTNKDKTDNKTTFDFKMSSTQQLIVRINVPDQKNAVITPEGCVTVMTGYKELK
ncbi:MAG: hypothetical protein IT223_07860 [Crocinitomicaceae bacterium]|nr:hypothetical protein [Crocinitomicaceae bacterium]